MKRLASYTAVIIATLALLVLAWLFRQVLGLFVLSLLAAATIRPLIARLVKRGVPLPIAMILIYVTSLGILGTLFYLFGRSLLNEVQTIANNVAVTYELSYPRWSEGTTIEQTLYRRLPPPSELYGDVTSGQDQILVQTLLGLTRSLFGFIGGLLTVLLLSVYWGTDQDRFERLWLSLLPAAQRASARDIWRAIETGVGAYLSSQLIQGLLAALLLGAGYWLLGLNYPTILAIVAGFAWLVPLVGSIFITGLAFVVGLAVSVELGLSAAVYTIVVLALLKFVVEPRIFDRYRYSSLLTILTMIPLTQEFGLIGLIVAPGLAVALQIFFSHLFSPRTAARSETAVKIANLEERLAQAEAMFTQREEPPPPEIVNIIERLQTLIQKADEALPPRTAIPRSNGR